MTAWGGQTLTRDAPTADNASVLGCRGVSKAFPGVQALAGVDFGVAAGEVHALVGENGAGKSTLVKIFSGGYRPDSGLLQIQGEDVRLRRPADAEARGVVTIHQEIILVPELDVATNLLLGAPPVRGRRLLGDLAMVDRKRLYETAARALREIHAGIDPRARARDLGVSAAQLVLLARGLLREMRILILDEPTAALTPQEADELFVKLRALRAKGVGIVYVSHRLDEVMALADRITVLRDGRAVATMAAQGASVDRVVELMLARRLGDMYPPPDRAAAERTALDVSHLSRANRRGGYLSLDDVSFRVARGEIVGITGLVGAGKTELARALCGVDPPDGGDVRVDGQPVRIRSPRDALQAGITLVPEDRKRQGLVLLMSVVQNLALAMANAATVRRAVTRLGQVLQWKRLAQVARTQVDRYRIRVSSIGQQVRDLSGGNQQKVVLAKCLATSPKVVVFDEPTRGIAVGSKADIYRIIDELVRQGLGVVLLSSEIEEVLHMSDRIYVMRNGAIVSELEAASTNADVILRYAATGR